MRAAAKRLEVIVTSLDEALEAEAGGADRLEVVSAFDQGGLTPALDVVQSIVEHVQVPLRVMLRDPDNAKSEFEQLLRCAGAFAKLAIEGLVTGFVHCGGQLDGGRLRRVIAAAPQLPLTFHRAFEELADPEAAIDCLKKTGAVDRILIRAGGRFTLSFLDHMAEMAGPEIELIVGVGLDPGLLPRFAAQSRINEFHVGRAAREPAAVFGRVTHSQVAAVKKALCATA